jgi:hypothetical protein
MKPTSGIIVEYLNKDGKIQKGVARYVDQRPEFKKVCKVCVRLLDSDLNLKKNENGKCELALVNEMKLSKIGYID